MAASPLEHVLRRLRQFAGATGNELADGELLDRFVQHRDEAAFAQLLQRHGRMILGVCRSLLHDPHDAEDAFQATFLVLVRSAPSVRKQSLLSSWLYRVACRTALRARAAAHRRAREEQAAAMEQRKSSALPPDSGDYRPVLSEELQQLPEKYRAPLLLCYLEGKTTDETAQQLGWPQGTVMVRLMRGRDLLRHRLTRRGVTLSAAGLTMVLADMTASAAVSPPLAQATLQAALLCAAHPLAAGSIPASVAALTEGVLKAMYLAKLKSIAALVAALVVLVGAALLAHQALADKTPKAAQLPEETKASQTVPAAAESAANAWSKLDENKVGPGFSPGLVWSPELKRFVFFCGRVGHHFKGSRPYDVMSFDPADRTWRNDLPKGAEKRGGETGNVKESVYKHPWFAMTDDEGLVNPRLSYTSMWYQYALAPWDGKIYALICGHTLGYDPKERAWKDTQAPVGPAPIAKHHWESLIWSTLCADPVNKEILLFGGCGVGTKNGSAGSWVYSTEKNQWRKLDVKVEPPPRALSPMVFDPATKKIVLFGGDGLDRLYADTWVYDCTSRTWEEKKPAASPAPRFGHALVRLPKSGKVVLLGGKGYSSELGYMNMLYRVLPFEGWTYDVGKNEWALIRLEKGAPPQSPNEAATCATAEDDSVLFIGSSNASQDYGGSHETWLCRLDAAQIDAEGTAKQGVKPGTLGYRTGAFDPEWYTKDVPPPDPAATAAILENLPPNQWVSLKCPRWPNNRMGGGWSTVTLDTDRDQLLHLCGGHSSYFGNDVAHYDIVNGRWSISHRPSFALEINYENSTPGGYGNSRDFSGAPWSSHNYHGYAYDPTIQRLVYAWWRTPLCYDPATRTWPYAEKVSAPFFSHVHTSYLCTTPNGVVCLAWTREGSFATGIWRLEGGKEWKAIKTSGDTLPVTVYDASTIAYDSKRDRLLMTTSPGDRMGNEPIGQVWSCDLKTGGVTKLNPEGREVIKSARIARESVYLPKADLLMMGYPVVDGKKVVPFYDCAANRWLVSALPGTAGFNYDHGEYAKSLEANVDLGLVYDAKRDLVWSVLCNLRGEGSLRVARIDKVKLGAWPLATPPVKTTPTEEKKP